MSVSKRRCATCRYFQDAGMSGNGWCTHPKRQLSSDVRILVRRGELACRDSWGVDFWEDPNADDPAAASTNSAPPASPPDTAMPVRASFDDEVTSVVSTDSTRPAADTRSDRVMDQTTFLPEDDHIATQGTSARAYRRQDLNEPADLDQQDRVDIMKRGNRQALLRAQERHRMRQGQAAKAPAQDNDDEDGPGESQGPSRRVAFAPDDYVEDEAPSKANAMSEKPDHADDVFLGEGAIPSSIRSRRLRRTRTSPPRPAHDAVPASEMSPDTSKLTSRPSDDSRFDSIPEIQSDVELPRLRRHVPESQSETPDVPADTHATNSPDATPDAVNPFDEVIKRAQAIKAAAKAEREARQLQERRATMSPIIERIVDPASELPDAAGLADETIEPDGAAWMNEPAPEAELEAPASAAQVDTEWLTSRGIRFQRHRPLAESADDADDAYPDEPAELHEDVLPEPAARQSWWRGFLRDRPSQRNAYDTPYYEEASDLAADGDYAGNDAYEAYHDGYDDQYASAEVQPEDNEPAWSADEQSDLIDDEYVDEFETTPVITTSMAAFDEDRHTFVERPHVPGPWQGADRSNDDAELAPQEHAYEPIDLGNEQGLSAFRSRLFTSTSDDLSQIDQTGPVARAPISVPRRPREERAQRHVSRLVEPEALLDDPQDAMYEPEIDPDFDVRALVAHQGELLDMTIAVAPDIPRKCATCRSYRASEQGERGWCTNSWAFTHRQMVNSDDLACQSSIGCWWLPADEEVWLEGDVDASYRSTPRVDRLVAHLDPIRRVAER